MKICMVTGGSGGHIYPAITFADYAKEKGHEIVFVGNADRMESIIVPQHGYEFHAISNKGLQGSIFDKIQAMLGQFKAIRDAKKLLRRLKPDIVFAFGGYVTMPLVLAAKHLGITVALHEQNALVGKANKMVAKHASMIFTSYETSFKGLSNVYFYGNPRSALDRNIDKKDLSEVERLNLDTDRKIVLCVMGSQGSTAMNAVFKDMLQTMKKNDYQIIIVTGTTNYDAFIKDLNPIENVVVIPYVNQALLLNHIDLIVARSGASTITEIASFNIPSILIPSPYVANNHQYYNAKALADKAATILVEESGLNGTMLYKLIDSTLNDSQKMETLSKNLETFKTPDVNANILSAIEDRV